MRFNELEYTDTRQLDFVPRSRRRQVWNIIAAFGLILVIISVLGISLTSGTHISALVFIALLLATLCFYVVYRKQQSLDLLMSAEYQNLLFSQAIALGTRFYLFVRSDGTIAYADDGLRDLFPKFSYGNAQALEGLFTQGNVPKPDRERVMGAIYSHRAERLVLSLAVGGETQEFILTVEPMSRPGGFSLVRGRAFHDTRSGMQQLPTMLRSTSVDKLEHLLTHTPVAQYTTDAYGQLEYANPAFEQLFGFAPGTMLEAKYGISQLFSALGGQPMSDYSLGDYSGEVQLATHDSALSTRMIFQHVMRDEAGKITGATGSILMASAK